MRQYFRSLLTRNIYKKFSALFGEDVKKVVFDKTKEHNYIIFVTKRHTYVFRTSKLYYWLIDLTGVDADVVLHVTGLKVVWDSHEERYTITLSGTNNEGENHSIRIVYENDCMSFPYPWRGVTQYKYSNITIDGHLKEMKPLGVAYEVSSDQYSLEGKQC